VQSGQRAKLGSHCVESRLDLATERLTENFPILVLS
jgi:hypothetical protein